MHWDAPASVVALVVSLWVLVSLPAPAADAQTVDDSGSDAISSAGAPAAATEEPDAPLPGEEGTFDAPPDLPQDPAALPLPDMATPEKLPRQARAGHLPLESGSASAAEPPSEEEASGELFGHFGFELRVFPLTPNSAAQPRSYNTSLAFKPGYSLELTERTTFRAIGFVRLDQHDNQRSHFDAREVLLQALRGPFRLTVGINKVFWGVTESRHLVDIINQTDLLEGYSGDAKYGQLMAMTSYNGGAFGSFELIAASWFRPQRYPSPAGRPGVPLPLLDEVYESDLRQYQIDFAARWLYSIGAFDWALSYFHGTSREPELIPVVVFGFAPPFFTPFVEPALVPYYALIHQVGLEFQWTRGGWLYKLESMFRTGQGPRFAATTAGFEYTFTGAIGSADIGLLLEYNYDGRDYATFNIYDNDAFGAVRVSANDEAGSQLLLGALTDVETGVTSGSLEASRRFGQNWKLALEGWLFIAEDDTDPLYWFRRDHYVETTLEYYY